MGENLANLSWQVQVALASGYAAYLLAYYGIREGHQTIDTVFVSLVFSVIASGVLWLLGKYVPLVSGGAAFIATCVAAIVWRGYVRAPLLKSLHFANISWSDDTPSAWAFLQHNSKVPFTQVAVELDDGTWLRCDRAGEFNNAPFGPVIIGQNGDIALYLTHEEKLGEEAKELRTVRDPDWGDRITYVPAARIRCVTMRFKER